MGAAMIDDHLRQIVREAVAEALAEWSPPPGAPTPEQGPRCLLRIDEVCDRTGLCDVTIRKLVKVGKLRAVRAFSSIRFDPRDVDACIEVLKEGR